MARCFLENLQITYRYNFDGELIAKIENYDNFFNAMTVKSGDLPDDKALKVIGFLKDNAVTKTQASCFIKSEAERCGQYYVNVRWPGGMLCSKSH